MTSSNILVLTPDLELDGGVTNYYRVLNLPEHVSADYFFVNSPRQMSRMAKALITPLFFIRFLWTAPKYKLIHVNPSLDFNSFFRDMVFVVLSFLMRKRVLIFFHGWEDGFQAKIQGNRLLQSLFTITYARADAFIVLGNCFKQKLCELGVSDTKPFYIETTVADSTGLNQLDLQKKSRCAATRIHCLYMSRVLRDKGIYIALEAYQEVRNANPDADLKFTVAGTGPDLDGAKQYVQDQGLEEVDFVGEVRDEDKSALLSKCHILLFPTYYGEGLPCCVLEAMLFGLVVISRYNAAIPEVVEHGVNGLLTDSVDSAVFAKFLKQLVTSPQTLSEISLLNHNTARTKFTTEKVRSRLQTIYRELLSDQGLVA